MQIDKHTTLADFIMYADILKIDEQTIDNLFERLKSYPLCDMLKISFNELKFRQLIDLQTKIKTVNDMIFVPLEVVHDLKQKDVLQLSAFDCLRFALHSKDELERITNLFKTIEYKPTADEVKAGINTISHGFFGTVDWYARRMGITNHDEVVELKWTRIYQCLNIDYHNNKFERNYRKVIEQNNKK